MQAALTSEALNGPPVALDPAHQAQLDALARTSDAGFDAAYIAAQKAAHVEAIGLFRTYSESGPAGALKAFAAATLPVLQKHDQHVRMLKPAR
jgi:putative membrane protein